MLRFRKFLCNNIFPGTYYSWILPPFSFKQQYSKHTSLKKYHVHRSHIPQPPSLQSIIFKICWVRQIIWFLLILKIMPGKTPPLYTCALYTQPPSQWRIQTITDKTWSHCLSAWGSKKNLFLKIPFLPIRNGLDHWFQLHIWRFSLLFPLSHIPIYTAWFDLYSEMI